MNIGIVSDTHGNGEYMEKVSGFLKEVHNVDLILHLGDSYGDGKTMLQQGEVEGVVVPGIYCDEYNEDTVDNIVTREYLGKRICCVHSIKDYRTVSDKHDIVFCGHTHIPSIEKSDNMYIINPGHLKEAVSKGYAPTYGILRQEEGKLIFEWYHPAEKPELCRKEVLI